MSKENAINLVDIKNEINLQLGDKETFSALMSTTFKGLEPSLVKRAVLEGRIRGFTFQDFLEKNVYAIPFKGGYSLVTSIDYARKLGMRSGIVGKSAPTYETENEKIISCTVAVQRKVGGHVGEYAATVFFKEYYKSGREGKPSLWETKPRTMIAKVAEMHALRMACPEELAQVYVEEEHKSEAMRVEETIDLMPYKQKLESAKTLDEVKSVWAGMPAQAKQELTALKEELKTKYANA